MTRMTALDILMEKDKILVSIHSPRAYYAQAVAEGSAKSWAIFGESQRMLAAQATQNHKRKERQQRDLAGSLREGAHRSADRLHPLCQAYLPLPVTMPLGISKEELFFRKV